MGTSDIFSHSNDVVRFISKNRKEEKKNTFWFLFKNANDGDDSSSIDFLFQSVEMAEYLASIFGTEKDK